MQSNGNTKFWHFCSLSTNSNQASYPLPMIFNNKSINSFLELPDAFSEFFSSVFKVVFSINSLRPNNSYALIKRDLHNLCLWSSNNGLQFNYNKCALLHYGQNNPLFTYTLGNHIFSAVQSDTDLGILRTLDLSYKEHCNNLISHTNRLSAYILCSFICCNPKFLSPLFVAYIRPLLHYASSIGSLNNVELINQLEGVQRMYTKRIPSIAHLSYNDCLTYLGLQHLKARRLCSDLLFLFKLKFGLTHLTLADFSINTSCLRTNRFISPIYSSLLTLISLFHTLSICGMYFITMLLMLFITYSFVACYY